MTKADIVAKFQKLVKSVQATVETFMNEVKNSLETGDNVIKRFWKFIVKTRAEKLENISKKQQ
jgi:DNA-binding protein HU-beta